MSVNHKGLVVQPTDFASQLLHLLALNLSFLSFCLSGGDSITSQLSWGSQEAVCVEGFSTVPGTQL